MAQSIKISDDEMKVLRDEAEISRRSIAGQAEHWMRIGRAIEKSSILNYERIKEALSGLASPDSLTGYEQELFFDLFSDSMEEVTPEQTAFFANRRKMGVGVGLDEDGNLVKQQPEH
jgi:hypothetical protein